MSNIILHPYQAELKSKIYNEWNSGSKNTLAVLSTGGGKCHGIDTPIMMFDGSIKPVQDVKIGDSLMGPDGQMRLVVKTTTGFDNLYEIKPKKGDSYIVNSQHILSLKQTRRSKNDPTAGQIVNIPLQEYISKSKHFKHLHKGWRVKINTFDSEINFDPYMFGLWLGDGHSRTGSITTPDEIIEDYCFDFAKQHRMKIRIDDCGERNCRTLFFSTSDAGKSYFGQFLHDENLVLNKHIPLKFKTASKKNRLQLLAGILDTDGHYTGKSFDLIFKQEQLLDDTIFLARSLGFSAYKKKCRKTATNTGATGDYYRCSINGHLDQIPTKVKKAKPRGQIKNVLMTGIEVLEKGYGEYFGFQILGTDHLYLLGDFTVTHNSIVVSDIILDGVNQGLSQAVIAHRNELVTQMSCHIANRGIPHRIIGSKSTISQAMNKHRQMFGKSFVHPQAQTSVVGIDTLVSRQEKMMDWGKQQDRWVIDEGHHLLSQNKWGKGVLMMPNAQGLGVTATPMRADGKGLGHNYDGVFTSLVEGPSMRFLIKNNFLADYEIVCPESDLSVDDSQVSANGDWSSQTLRKASKKSHIVGDTVDNYIKYAFGRKAIVFATDVETAGEIANNFMERGIPAASLSAKTPTAVREKRIQDFRDGKVWALVNVDLFDEGFDVPACDVVILARPTASLGKYRQMVGRALRYMEGKVALIIDQVSNVVRHGLPDKQLIMTLARREKRGKQEPDPDEIPLTTCVACLKPYERFRIACPHCGAEKPLPEPRSRSVDMVEGDLVLLDRETLERMRQATVMENPADVAQRVGAVAGEFAGKGAANRQLEKIEQYKKLEHVIAQWAAIEREKGFTDSEIMRKFYLTLGVDVISALDASQTRADMEILTNRIERWYKK